MKGIDTILFDWDGTLVDTAAHSFLAFQASFRDLGISVSAELYEQVYTPNWYSMYQALQLPKQQWQLAEDLWLKHYAHESVPMVQNGRSTLKALINRGYCLGLVTSGNQSRVLREINKFDLTDIFKAVVCNEDVVQKKPHPEGLTTAMRRLEKEPGVCCYVGDSPDDIEMGKRANVRTIGILSNYPNNQKLPQANPDLCFENLTQLLQHFDSEH